MLLPANARGSIPLRGVLASPTQAPPGALTSKMSEVWRWAADMGSLELPLGMADARFRPYRLSAKDAWLLRSDWRSRRTLMRKNSSSSWSSSRFKPGRRCA